MRFALYSKNGEFVATVETRGAYTPDIIVWGQRYFYRPSALGHGLPSAPWYEAVVDTAVTSGAQEPP